MRKLALVLVVLVLAGIGGFFGLRAYADREADRQVALLFAELESGGIKASRQSVGFDLMSRTLDLAGLDFASSAGTTKIEHFKAIGFEETTPGRIKAQRIELTGLSVDSTLGLAPGSNASYRVPRLVIENYEGPAQIEAGGGDVAIVLRDFLTSFAADRISIPEATIATRVGADPNATVTEIRYGATVLAGIRGGTLADLATDPARFTIKGPADQPTSSGSGEVGKIAAQNIDLVLNLLPFTPPANTDNAFRTLYGRLTIDGLRLKTDNGMSVESGAATLADAAMRPSAALMAEVAALGSRIELSQQDGNKPAPEDLRRMMVALAELGAGIRIGSFAIADIAIGVPDQGRFAVGSLRMGPLADGRFTTMAFEKMEGTTPSIADKPSQPFKIERFALNGFDFTRLMRLADTALSGRGDANSLQNRLAALRILEGIEISGLVGPVGDGSDGELKLDTFQLSWGSFVGALPTKFAGTLRLDAPLAAFEDQEWAALLADGGAKRATVALDIGGAWNEADKTVTLAPLFAEVSQAFSASAKVSFGGLGREAFNEDASQALAAAAQATFGGASLNLADLGLYELKIAEVAKENDATPEEVRELFTGIAEMMVTQATEDRPNLEAAGKAVLDFLAAPRGKLAVTLTPKEPLPIVSALIASQVDPTGLLDVVDIEATSSR
ncbi:hypothetical protein [Ancylobacter terrae]|uniref:hypothetical protein n=1 Tax=Ancylobacter sp. sgz301288 TaxID=3342077 RepID=UPI003859380C